MEFWMFVHFQGVGPARQLAQSVRAVLTAREK